MMSKPNHVNVGIVGAGASGVIHSLVLAQAGFRVVCLDQGG
jgi:cation diffusion facilitator CzcD-associated flavoprotein CzcO